MSLTRKPASRTRTAVAANLGAVLEWFDLVLYALFAVVLGRTFFPTTDPNVSLLLSLGAFAISWLVRPLGAVVIGAYSDRVGRKPGLTLSAGLMMLGTAMIAFMPGYDTIGLAAPVLVMVARMVQGFSAGGEFGSATALLAEQDPNRRGFYASLQWAASGLSVLLASLAAYAVNTTLTPDQVASWGWRVPFMFGLLIGPVALYIRSQLDEPEEFLRAEKAERPMAELLHMDKTRVLLGAGIVAAGACGSFLNTYMPTFAFTKLGLPQSQALLGTIAAGLVNTLLPPVFGALSDRAGRAKVMAVTGVLGLLMIYPLFRWLIASPSTVTLVTIQALIALVFYCGYYATVPAALADLFPVRRRTSGVSIAYVLAQTLFGGVTPLVVGWIVATTGDPTSPGLYLGAVMLLSLVCLAASARLLSGPAILHDARA
ncbi:MFS transporter [Roseomonas elaeocarpi]|uniref:MFS transporter n=1 Tax=Roseomonas elaeocarpi TaxID=907779 RepID=A0ABV6JQ16_9PROT